MSLLTGAEAAELAGLTLPDVTVRLEPLSGALGDTARAALARLSRVSSFVDADRGLRPSPPLPLCNAHA